MLLSLRVWWPRLSVAETIHRAFAASVPAFENVELNNATPTLYATDNKANKQCEPLLPEVQATPWMPL